MHGVKSNHHHLDRRPITIILRLVVDERGTIVHGAIVDVKGIPISHFNGYRAMTRALRAWLVAQSSGATK